MLPVFVVLTAKSPGSVPESIFKPCEARWSKRDDLLHHQRRSSVAFAEKLGGCRSNPRQMTAHGSSFGHLVVWREPGDLSWRHDNEGKGEAGGSYGLTVDPTGCETDWNASDWSLVDTLLNTPPTKKSIRKIDEAIGGTHHCGRMHLARLGE